MCVSDSSRKVRRRENKSQNLPLLCEGGDKKLALPPRSKQVGAYIVPFGRVAPLVKILANFNMINNIIYDIEFNSQMLGLHLVLKFE